MTKKPSKKSVPCTGEVSGTISDALSALTELRDEFQEILDNTPDALQSTDLYATREATVDALSFVDEGEPDVPESVAELTCTWTENKKSTSRATRCANAVAALEAARDALQAWLDDDANEEHEDRDEVDQLSNTLDEWAGSADGAEWPGMFG